MHAVGHRDLGHAHKIVLDHLQRRRSGIAGDVVGAGHDMHRAGPQVDHILAKTKQQLRRGLPADTAADAAGAKERRRLLQPAFGDGITEEHRIDPGPGGPEFAILVTIACQIRPVRPQPLLFRGRGCVCRHRCRYRRRRTQECQQRSASEGIHHAQATRAGFSAANASSTDTLLQRAPVCRYSMARSDASCASGAEPPTQSSTTRQ